MGKITKVLIHYEKGVLTDETAGLLGNADENDLRILVALLMLVDPNTAIASTSELAEKLGIAQAEVDASLKFWRGAGVLSAAGNKNAGKASAKEGRTESPKAGTVSSGQSAHRGGALERSGALENYSSAELAELMERRRVSAEFVDEAQRIVGKVFRAYDTGILVGIVDQLGFEEEAVLAILAYGVRRGKKTLRYAEQVAMAMYDDGLTDTHSVMERISRIERSGEIISKIRALFGASDREMTATEKRMFTAWTEKYAYDMDVIRLAYDITVDTIQKPVPKYTNSILEKWHAEGLHTVRDVEQYIDRNRSDRSGESSSKSYDVEDFFEAALQRSYENLQ
ncbi:MAG: DnaD domain protein [Clostridia bacterium]|nr:DnaD domain protein [Clostridia bacterium]